MGQRGIQGGACEVFWMSAPAVNAHAIVLYYL